MIASASRALRSGSGGGQFDHLKYKNQLCNARVKRVKVSHVVWGQARCQPPWGFRSVMVALRFQKLLLSSAMRIIWSNHTVTTPVLTVATRVVETVLLLPTLSLARTPPQVSYTPVLTVATHVVETVPSYTPVLTCPHRGNTALALTVLTCSHCGNTALALTVLAVHNEKEGFSQGMPLKRFNETVSCHFDHWSDPVGPVPV